MTINLTRIGRNEQQQQQQQQQPMMPGGVPVVVELHNVSVYKKEFPFSRVNAEARSRRRRCWFRPSQRWTVALANKQIN